MAGLVRAIHAEPPHFPLNVSIKRRRVDGRDKPGHDAEGAIFDRSRSMRFGTSSRVGGANWSQIPLPPVNATLHFSGDNSRPRQDVKMRNGSKGKGEVVGRMGALMLVLCAAAAPVRGAQAQDAPNSPRLTCSFPGGDGLSATDEVDFEGAGVEVRLGVTRQFGGIAVSMILANPNAPGSTLDLIEARSGGGAAWQTSVQTGDGANDRIVNYNQSAGNSARNWGFEGKFQVSSEGGAVQKGWLPIWSDDYRFPMRLDAPDYRTSPCLPPAPQPGGTTTGFQLGEGRDSITPSHVDVAGVKALRLTNAYSVRSAVDQDWAWYAVDQALYMHRSAVRQGDLRVYVAQEGRPVLGPIALESAPPEALRPQLRNVFGGFDDWSLAAWPTKYVVLAFTVGGEDIGIAVHMDDNRPFMGFLRYRPHLACRRDSDQCGNVQWHTKLSSQVDPSVRTRFHAVEITRYAVDYDIAPLTVLAAEGFATR